MSETAGWKHRESKKQMWCPTCKKVVVVADKICTECLCFDCHSLGDKPKRAAHRTRGGLHMKSETTGWQNYRKTINGTEYRLETKWQSSRKPRLWRAITAN